MPTYMYHCKQCGFEFEEDLPIAKRRDYESTAKYSDCEMESDVVCDIALTVVSPRIGYGNAWGGKKKPDREFNNKLKEIKKAHRGSTINVIE